VRNVNVKTTSVTATTSVTLRPVAVLENTEPITKREATAQAMLPRQALKPDVEEESTVSATVAPLLLTTAQVLNPCENELEALRDRELLLTTRRLVKWLKRRRLYFN